MRLHRGAAVCHCPGRVAGAEHAPNREKMMRRVVLGGFGLSVAAMCLGLSMSAAPAWSQETLKIGVLSTLSGQSAVLGQHMRDGFNLAVKQRGGKVGGLPTEILVVDDELKPDVAVTKVKAMVERDNVQFVVGPIFSNVLAAIYRPVTESKTVLISPNAGPSSFAGKACSPYFVVTSYQNDQNHEVLGKVAQDRNLKRVVLLVP